MLSVIRKSFHACPPVPSKFQKDGDYIPKDLEKLLSFVMNMASAHQSEIRLIGSIGQDICRAATRGQWKLPKHIFLCRTLCHLFRCKELTTLMNKFGHWESYSFSLEVETVIAETLEETSSLLSGQILRNPSVPFVFHSDFDNFDQFVNDLSGAGSVHTCKWDHVAGILRKLAHLAMQVESSRIFQVKREQNKAIWILTLFQGNQTVVSPTEKV